jgi:hypothetical protein
MATISTTTVAAMTMRGPSETNTPAFIVRPLA